MSGAGRFSMARSRNGDRFYNPPAIRRHQQQKLLQEQQQEHEQYQLQQNQFHHQNQMMMLMRKNSTNNRTESDDSSSSSSKPSISPPPPKKSLINSTNLDRFLESVIPSVPTQSLSKTSMKALKSSDKDCLHPYFNLGDLWESFKEWSAYGAGVPLVLNGIDSVVQYYVPYLSGIQLYVDPSKPSPRLSRPGEESDAESSRETSSDGSDCDLERQSKHLQDELWTKQNPADVQRSFRDKPLNGTCSDDGELGIPPGKLIFQYMEREAPYSREPLADKIAVLASRFPELKAYKSCDLLSSSWISVAWYPIYRIPTGPTLQDLDACFLTFHSLSTPMRNTPNDLPQVPGSSIVKFNGAIDSSSKLTLPVFGLASYKFKGSVWTPNGSYEHQQASSLLQGADNWLRLLQVDHPDYRFFASHNTHRR
ncbi:hypothetical protein MKX01_031874 [Papaver californicum]|nr:hypothetical protein MKX01_031874 [Papaver californicum]